MFCTGTYERSMDGKRRILLPKTVRYYLHEDKYLFLTPGTDGCLEIHNEASLGELAARSQNSRVAYQSRATFSRIFFAQSQRCEIDASHRLRVAGSLSDLVELESPVVIVGVGGHWEIWNRSVWHRYLQQNQTDFDHHAKIVRGGGDRTEPLEEVVNKPR